MTRLHPAEIRSELLVRSVPFDDVESAHRGPIRGGIGMPDLDDRVSSEASPQTDK
jgi:hypothetical protein